MALVKNCPIPADEICFHDAIIWDEEYKTLEYFEQFEIKTISATINFAREIFKSQKHFDLFSITPEELIKYYKENKAK